MLFTVMSHHQKSAESGKEISGKEGSSSVIPQKGRKGGTLGSSANTHQGGMGAATKEGGKKENNAQEDIRSVISLHHY